MLNNASCFDWIYIACGYTDLCQGIDGLSAVIRWQLGGDPFQKNVLFMSCGRKPDKIKFLIWEGAGFLLLDALLSWANSRAARPKSSLGKAFTYLEEQWPYLVNYLKDGRLEISNNWAERSIKPFIIDRKIFFLRTYPEEPQAVRLCSA